MENSDNLVDDESDNGLVTPKKTPVRAQFDFDPIQSWQKVNDILLYTYEI